MSDIRTYQYSSVLKPYIEGFLSEKRELGFIYNDAAYQLYRLDSYWKEHEYQSPCMTFEMLDEWLCAKPGEGKSGHKARISASNLLAIYLNTIGIPAYVPLIKIGITRNVVHVFSHSELHELFEVIDNYISGARNPEDKRMEKEYPVMFRLYYCCGMRNNEVCSLKAEHVDFDRGIITVLNGKNQKDRLVYLADDLRTLVCSYYLWLTSELGEKPYWMFPGRDRTKHVPKTTVDAKFAYFWNQTEASKHCDKKPTPHCLRHTFVVDRFNSWIKAGLDRNVMIIYLSKFLGHKSPDETFYYYHMVSDAFQIIREKDTMADVIPEVRRR